MLYGYASNEPVGNCDFIGLHSFRWTAPTTRGIPALFVAPQRNFGEVDVYSPKPACSQNKIGKVLIELAFIDATTTDGFQGSSVESRLNAIGGGLTRAAMLQFQNDRYLGSGFIMRFEKEEDVDPCCDCDEQGWTQDVFDLALVRYGPFPVRGWRWVQDYPPYVGRYFADVPGAASWGPTTPERDWRFRLYVLCDGEKALNSGGGVFEVSWKSHVFYDFGTDSASVVLSIRYP